MAPAAVDEAYDYDVLISCPQGLTAEQVLVDFAPQHDRQPHPDAQHEEVIEKAWQKKRERNPTLYNGSKFRYAGFEVLETQPRSAAPGPAEAEVQQKWLEGPAPDAQIAKLALRLGLSDYRTFMGTNLKEAWPELVSAGETDAARCRHFADPLGNAAMVRTADGQALLLQRGHTVGEFPDHPVFPGGHSEPVEVGIAGHKEGQYDEERRQLNTLIGLEMFAGIIREVEEETGAPADSLSNVLFVGLVRRKKNARPVAMFVCDCALTFDEILEKYQTAEHKFESTRLRAVPFEDLHKETDKMPGCHRGGCALALAFLERQGQVHLS